MNVKDFSFSSPVDRGNGVFLIEGIFQLATRRMQNQYTKLQYFFAVKKLAKSNQKKCDKLLPEGDFQLYREFAASEMKRECLISIQEITII